MMTSSIVEFIIDSDFEDDDSEGGHSPAPADSAGSSRESTPEAEPEMNSDAFERQSLPKPTTAPIKDKQARKHQAIEGAASRHSGRLADPGYKSFACNLCQESFNFKFELLRHKMAHYEKPKRTPLLSAAERWKIKFKKHHPMNKGNAGKRIPSLKNTKGVSLISRKPGEKLDDPRLLTPLDQGWSRLVVYRPNTAKPVCDVYYQNPGGRKFRSSNELAKEKFENELSLANFTFARRPLDVKHSNEIVRPAGSPFKTANSLPVDGVKEETTQIKTNSPPKVPSKAAPSKNGRRIVEPIRIVKNVPKSPVKEEVVPNSKTAPPPKAPSKFHCTKYQSRNDDERKFLLPLNHGWVRLVVRRPRTKAYDVYYLNSEGQKFRSLNEMRNEKFKNGITLENFSFKRCVLRLQHPREIVRTAGSKSRTTKSLAIKPMRKEVPGTKATPTPKIPSKTEGPSARKEALSRLKRSPIATRKIRAPNHKFADAVVTSLKSASVGRHISKSPSKTRSSPVATWENEPTNSKTPKIARKPSMIINKPETSDSKNELEDQNFLLPLSQGWSRLVVFRRGLPRTCDIYYENPAGRKFRSLRELKKELNVNGKRGKGLSSENFTFVRRPLDLDHPNQITLKAGERLMGRPKKSSPPRPLRPLTSLIPKTSRRVLAERRIRPSFDPKLDFLSQLDLDSKDFQPRVVLEDILLKKLPKQLSILTHSEEPVDGWCDTHSAEVVDLEVDVGGHTCEHCWLEFDTMHDLLSHQRGHVAEGWILDKQSRSRPDQFDFLCYHCGFHCKTKLLLVCHMTKHTRKSKTHPYECGTCGYRSRLLSYLERHKQVHSNNRPFACHECGHRSKNKKSLKGHIEVIHLGLKPFACSKCEYRGSRKLHLKYHMEREHTVERRYKCERCNHRAKSLGQLRVHGMVHSGLKRFVCQECDYSTNFNRDLRHHMSVHTGWKPYQCSLCEYKCCRITYLKNHMRVHTGERPFRCELCHKSFSHRSTLRKHMDGHYRVYRFKCAFCPYKTQYQTAIKYHEKLHEGDREQNCPHCPKSFIDLHSLNLHMRVHTGEKPIKCDVCKDSFAFRVSWKHHLLKCDPEHPALRSRRSLIAPLPREEATKAIIKAAAAKPRSHERTILDFMNRNQVKSDSDDSHLSNDGNHDKSDTDCSHHNSNGKQAKSETGDSHHNSDDCDNTGPDQDTESVTLVETARASPHTISSDSNTSDQETPVALRKDTTSSKEPAKQTPSPTILHKPPPKATMFVFNPPSQLNVSGISHCNQYLPQSSHANDIPGPRETVIRKKTKSAMLEFIMEPDDVPSHSKPVASVKPAIS